MFNVAGFERKCDRLRQLFSVPAAVLFVPIVVIVWRLIGKSPADPDLFARVGMGRLVEKFGGVTLHDPFAFTEKLPMWIDHEWLSGVVFYHTVSSLGDAGLVFLKLVVAVWTCLLLIRASLLYTPQASARLVWTGICILEASFLWVSTLRCQVFTYFFLALTYYAFVQYRVNAVSRYLVLIPFVSVVLVNMHGGYALELLVLWILTSSSLLQGRRWKLLAVVAALSSFAPAVTPYGFQTFTHYLVHALTMERSHITEWFALYRDPIPFVRTSLITIPLLAGVLITLRKREVDLTALGLLCFSFYCGFKHVRFVGFAMLTATVFGVPYFGRTVELMRARLRSRMLMLERSFALVSAVLVVGMIVQIVSASVQPKSWRLDTRSYPVKALEWLRTSGATGKLLVDFNNGSFALWRLYPRFLISMDGRYEEVYTNQAVADVAAAFSPNTAEGRAALYKLAPTHILYSVSGLSQQQKSALPSEWHEVYRDELYVVYSILADHPTPSTPAQTVDNLWKPLF